MSMSMYMHMYVYVHIYTCICEASIVGCCMPCLRIATLASTPWMLGVFVQNSLGKRATQGAMLGYPREECHPVVNAKVSEAFY